MDYYPQIDLNERWYSEYLAVQALTPSTRPTDLHADTQMRHFLPRIVAGISPRSHKGPHPLHVQYRAPIRRFLESILFSEACRNG